MAENNEILLKVSGLKKYFPVRNSLFAKEKKFVKAIDGVDFSVAKGKTIGLVGESGCGKTTVGKCILGIFKPTAGEVIYQGQDLAVLSDKQILSLRRELQMVFQDPNASLDPRQMASSIIREAIVGDGLPHYKKEIQERTGELLSMVGLSPELGDRYPHEMSGGQLQRLAVARALACNPKLIVCDEPISALDVSIQAQVINLFENLQQQLDLTYVFIAHDLSVVRHIADEIAVMYLGRIVEHIKSDDLYEGSKHPYTKTLLSAVPVINYKSERSRQRIVLSGEIPSPIDAPSGCTFHPRCPYATEQCKLEIPKLTDVGGGHLVACHCINTVETSTK